MAATAQKTDPGLWQKVKAHITAGAKGGKAGHWSARKAQMAVGEYKAKGGGYRGKKTADNHLTEWTQEDWGTKSGKRSAETGERYLPKRARAVLTEGEYKRTTEKKRADTKRGAQFSRQPVDVAKKTAAARSGPSRAALMKEASQRGVRGRWRMTKAALARALHHPGAADR